MKYYIKIITFISLVCICVTYTISLKGKDNSTSSVSASSIKETHLNIKDATNGIFNLDFNNKDIIDFNSKSLYCLNYELKEHGTTYSFNSYDNHASKNSVYSKVDNVLGDSQDYLYIPDKYFIYAPVVQLDEKHSVCQITKIDLSTNTTQILAEIETDMPFVFLNALNDNKIIIHYPLRNTKSHYANAYNYYIDLLDINTKSMTHFLQTSTNPETNTGKVISTVASKDNHIYVYTIDFKTKAKSIEVYSVMGKLIKTFSLEFINDVLQVYDEPDSVYNMEVFGDYIVLRTLSNRNILLKMHGSVLTEIKLPSALQEVSGGNIMLNSRLNKKLATFYFSNYQDKNIIYKFDTSTGILTSIVFESPLNEKIVEVQNNFTNDLLVITSKGKHKCKAYSINSSKLK